jgi:HK97 family phage portal protein
MGLFDLFRRETKDSKTGAVLVMNSGQAVWTKRDYAHFADEAYIKNVVVYQSISRVADAVASVNWEVWRGDDQFEEHPLLTLLKRPNPAQSWSEFVRAKIGFHLIAGNSYDERLTAGGETKELYTLRPDRMKVIPSNNGMAQAYVYSTGNKSVRWDVDAQGNCDIRHMKAFNPLDDWYGLSPVEPGAYAIDQHTESMKWMQALLQNSAQPSGALSMKEGQLSDDQFNRLKAQIDEQHQGAKNAGRPMLLEGGLSWEQMGLSPQAMQIVDGKNSSARDVCLAFGVPPQLLGIPGDNTYSNYKEARLAFWEDTVVPLVTYLGEEWSNWLGDGEVELRPNLDLVPAIIDKRMDLWAMADKSADLTINERRALKGYEPLPDGDVREAVARNPQNDPSLLKALAYGEG